MKKIMYLLNVNWNWIKQRPQYIAESLSKYYVVDVFEKKGYKKNNLVNNTCEGIKLYRLFRLPFDGKNSILKKISIMFMRYQLKKYIDKYNYVWISNAMDYDLIKKYIKNQVLIYDCMDDVIEFSSVKKDESYKNRYIKNEFELIKKSRYVFVSSEYLKNVLLKRYNIENVDKFYVLNNAVSSSLIDLYNNTSFNDDRKIVTYIGTISNWMDWGSIIESIERFDNIEFHFYGPIEYYLPESERILYKGIISQKEILSVMKKSDMLIMPFVVNDLILSVNPVKLYEYILADVPVLASGYSETEKFRDFVYLYYNKSEFLDTMQKLSIGTLRSKSNNGIDFVMENTWESRGESIFNLIEK